MTSDGSRGLADLVTIIEPAQFMSEQALRIRALSVERWGDHSALEMVGFSPKFLELQSKLAKAARYKEPVLITGESGVGKEAFAQAVYLLGAQKSHPYVSVNCPQHQDGNLTVSELFGHTRGSFTGAIADRRGAFEEADGGVIFLDEVGDLHLTAQAMLLRSLQTGEFKPLGATKARTAAVRVVSATNRNLNTLVVTNQFRYDLLFRLWYFHLAVPPLRDRGDDWRLIVDYCLMSLAKKYGIAKRMSGDALHTLGSYHWPGNVRQLISVVTMGYAMAEGTYIEPDDFVAEFNKPADTEPITRQTAPLENARENARENKLEPPAVSSLAAGDIGTELFDRITRHGDSFWQSIYERFMDRDLNRSQVRALVKKGLTESDNNYRRLLVVFRMPASDYQRFMDFLRHHNLKP
jgi:DNA-binding NtrC family response regulator